MAEPKTTPNTTPDPPETKECPACDAVIGKSETTCPKCTVDFEELEDTLASVEKANAILEKRRKKANPDPPLVTQPAKKESKLRGLGRVLRKKVS